MNRVIDLLSFHQNPPYPSSLHDMLNIEPQVCRGKSKNVGYALRRVVPFLPLISICCILDMGSVGYTFGKLVSCFHSVFFFCTAAMVSYTEPDLEIFISFDFRFGIHRSHLEDVVLPSHQPPLELVERGGTDQGSLKHFTVRDPNTLTTYDIDTILLSCVEDYLVEKNGRALGNLKRSTDDISHESWTLDAIALAPDADLHRMYEGSDEFPVGKDDGMKAYRYNHQDNLVRL